MSKNSKETENKDDLNKKDVKKAIRIIWRYLKSHKRLVFILIGLSVVSGALSAAVPYLAGRIFDEIVAVASDPAVALTSVFIFIALWFAVKLGGDTTGWYINFNSDKLGVLLHTNYRAKGVAHLLRLPLSFHKETAPAESSRRITRASRNLSQIGSSYSIDILPQVLSILVAFAIAYYINPLLTFVLAVAVGIYIAILWRSVPKLAEIQEDIHDSYVEAHRHSYDALDNVKEVKQATMEDDEEEKIDDLYDTAAGTSVSWMDLFHKLSFWQRVIIAFTQLTIFSLSVYLVQDGTITPGELVAFNGYAGMMFGPFITLARHWERIQSGLVEILKAEEILQHSPEEYNPENGISLERVEGDIIFKNVTFGYEEEQEVLDGMSFSAKPGQSLALVGRSGEGKSTVVNLLMGFHFPDEGKITVDGNDIKKLNLTSYRSRIGVVSQEPVLFNAEISKNIGYGTDASKEEMKEAAKKAHAHEFIKDLPDGYDQLVGWRGIKLSSGQKQRIALAREFLKDPDILILDEPTSALDAESERYVQDAIKELMEDRTTFIIAHRLSTVREADNILVLKDGKVTESGTHKSLVQKDGGIYRKLYKMQTEFY